RHAGTCGSPNLCEESRAQAVQTWSGRRSRPESKATGQSHGNPIGATESAERLHLLAILLLPLGHSRIQNRNFRTRRKNSATCLESGGALAMPIHAPRRRFAIGTGQAPTANSLRGAPNCCAAWAAISYRTVSPFQIESRR